MTMGLKYRHGRAQACPMAWLDRGDCHGAKAPASRALRRLLNSRIR